MDRLKLSLKLQALFEIHAPDETYRVRCPHCQYVLAEGVFGGARFRCRSCKWEGVVIRGAHFASQQVTTLTPGNAARARSNIQRFAASKQFRLAAQLDEERRRLQNSRDHEESHEQA